MPGSRRAGLTLIEVVAAVMILGVILVGMVLAKARHTHQLALVGRQRAAIRAADELLTQWWSREQGVPVGQTGTLATEPALTWSTQVVDDSAARELGLRVVRLEVRPTAEDGHTVAPGDTEPAVTVDLLLPDPQRPLPEDEQDDAAPRTSQVAPSLMGGRS